MGRPCAEIPQRSAGLLPGQPEMLISRGRPGLQRNRSCARCPLWGPRHANTAEGSWEASGAVILLPCQPLALSKEAGVITPTRPTAVGGAAPRARAPCAKGTPNPGPRDAPREKGSVACGIPHRSQPVTGPVYSLPAQEGLPHRLGGSEPQQQRLAREHSGLHRPGFSQAACLQNPVSM